MDYSRLREGVTTHRLVREPFRRNRRALVKLMMGKWVCDTGSELEQPLNIIELAQSVYLQHLASACPKALVVARSRRLRAAANSLQLALNHLVEYEIKFESTLQRVVQDALFGHAILKTGVSRSQVELLGVLHDVGQPYCDRVSEDDFVFDTGATLRDERHFAGNHYCVPYFRLAESGLLTPQAMARVRKTERSGVNENGDERTETISQGSTGSRARAERLYDMVDLWELHCPLENKLVIFQADDNLQCVGDPLYTEDYDGPEDGPFDELIFEDIPDQPTGLPILSLLRDLHVAVNNDFRKTTDQAGRSKSNPVFPGKSQADAERLTNAQDGETVRCEDADKIRAVRSGGVDQQVVAHMADAIGRVDYFYRLSALGGLGPMSDTNSQDERIAATASQRVAKMGDRVTSLVKTVFGKLAWHLLNEPGLQPPITYRVPGSAIEIDDRYTPDKREGDYLEFEFQVVPYSNRLRTPADELRELDAAWDRIVRDAAIGMQAGILPNFEGYLKARAELSGFRYLEDLITYAGPRPPEEQPAAPQTSTKPATTNRNYTRTSRSGGPGLGGNDPQVLAMMAAGGDSGVESA